MPSIPDGERFRLKWPVKGLDRRRRRTSCALDRPIQSEKGLVQEIDGELRRVTAPVSCRYSATAVENPLGRQLSALSP